MIVTAGQIERKRGTAVERWKINLAVLWIGQFLVMSGMTMIMPFLPLYLQDLGMTNEHEIAIWASIIFAGNFVTSFLAQPIWGGLADRYGRKVMLLRSGFGMAVVMTLMGFADSAWQLLLLRMVNGTISGFAPAAIALMSASAPRERMGFAMGTLQSGGVAGTILGPLMGGAMAEWIGYRPIFYVTGALLFTASVLASLLVKESFNKTKAQSQPRVSVLAGLKQLGKIPQLPALFSITFLIQFAVLSPMTLIPLFVQDLHGKSDMLPLLAGLVGSVNGFSNVIASPLLGRLGDKIGQQRILLVCLIGAAAAFIPQALVSSVWQLIVARFFFGMFIGGLLPSVNALIRQYTPEGMESRAYSFNTSTLSLGNMIGPLVGTTLSMWIGGIRGIFVLAAVLLIANAIWARKALAAPKTEKA
jgi:MFS family permease